MLWPDAKQLTVGIWAGEVGSGTEWPLTSVLPFELNEAALVV